MMAIVLTVTGILFAYWLLYKWSWHWGTSSEWHISPIYRRIIRFSRKLSGPIVTFRGWKRELGHEHRMDIWKVADDPGAGPRFISVGEITCSVSLAKWLQYHLPPNLTLADRKTHHRFTRDEWPEYCRQEEARIRGFVAN